MKRNTIWVAAFAVLLMAGCGDVGDAPEAETADPVDVEQASGTTYTIDTAASSIDWKAAKVTNAHDGGFNEFQGSVSVEEGQLTNAEVTIEMNSIWADNEKLTGHLKSGDFFLVEEHPTARFEASSFEPVDTSGATHVVVGNLTIRDVTNSVSFPATIEITDERITAQADFIINRKNWNINYAGAPDDLIEDGVRLMFNIVATPES